MPGQEMFKWYDEQKSWVLGTRNFSGTMAIGLSFVFLAYILHPAVETAFHRVRAYQGWRKIETSQTVEVTNYSLLSEIFGGRGRWDAARIVAILLAVFSLASWGLELQMDLSHIDDFVTDLFLRPPPVWKSGDDWHVIQSEALHIVEGEVPNMDKNFSVGTARARYEVDNDTTNIIDGKVQIASWGNDIEDINNDLFYDDNGEGIGKVTSHDCFDGDSPVHLYVDGEINPRGSLIECKNGPERVNGDNDSAIPALKFSSGAGDVYFIVEESITYPSFLYSVWKAKNDTDGSKSLRYVFYISSSVRLVEAVVTEVVHADKNGKVPTGGRSFALLRIFSENNRSYDVDMEDRASLFGEHPTGERPVDIHLSTIETIEDGVKLNTTALLCAVWLMTLALVGMASSLLLRSSVQMDIYDRDELIRAVALANSSYGIEHSSKMRIFVRKGEGGKLRVVISDADFHPRNCLRRCHKRHGVVPINGPLPKYTPGDSYKSGDLVVPSRPLTVWLEGVRIGKGRMYPGRRGNYRYPTSIAVITSPVPSYTGSMASTPNGHPASPADVPRIRQFPGVDPALFASVRSRGSCDGNSGDVEMDVTQSNEEPMIRLCNDMSSSFVRRSESHKTEVFGLQSMRVQSESSTTLHDRSLISPPARLTTGSSFDTSERLGPSSANTEEKGIDSPNGSDEAELTDPEDDVVGDDSNELV